MATRRRSEAVARRRMVLMEVESSIAPTRRTVGNSSRRNCSVMRSVMQHAPMSERVTGVLRLSGSWKRDGSVVEGVGVALKILPAPDESRDTARRVSGFGSVPRFRRGIAGELVPQFG
jgi:hypothetical protein